VAVAVAAVAVAVAAVAVAVAAAVMAAVCLAGPVAFRRLLRVPLGRL
jgi:hypothetical protein